MFIGLATKTRESHHVEVEVEDEFFIIEKKKRRCSNKSITTLIDILMMALCAFKEILN
jgi:hypothetical protein